ncbi:MAG TPA: zinc-ribbon domain-containing protein [Mycobacteriales bacterium]|nr:zinc-ribbon domain-containing protein [Mycobacteriales bacterium]
MLIFGFRVTSALLTTLTYVCDRCGQPAAHHVVKRSRKFTLFFIPLFPVSTKYVDTCTYCGRTLEVPKGQAEAALAPRAA